MDCPVVNVKIVSDFTAKILQDEIIFELTFTKDMIISVFDMGNYWKLETSLNEVPLIFEIESHHAVLTDDINTILNSLNITTRPDPRFTTMEAAKESFAKQIRKEIDAEVLNTILNDSFIVK